MKRNMLLFAAGFLSAIVFAIYIGGENIVQFGLKLVAFETTYDFAAVPRVSSAEAAVPMRSKAAVKRVR